MKNALLLLSAAALLAQAPPPAPAVKVTPEELAALREAVKPLTAKLSALQSSPLLADVAVYEKAVQNLLRYPDEFYTPNTLKQAHEAIRTGLERVADIEANRVHWPRLAGRVLRGYKSKVDDSFQPYRLIIPPAYTPTKPIRLDVILHGRNARLTETTFLAVDPKAKPLPENQTWIELEVYGRGNNAYRWAGETDVFEAIEDVRKNYNIDPDRILLRGFSMGGAGAWHIGLHHPSSWAGVEAGAGFTETVRYANKANAPAHERAAMRIYDAVDYAPNIVNTPTVGYGGEIDKQLQASVNIKDAIEAENIRANALFLVGPQTEHKWHPDSKAESEAFLAKNLPRKTPETFHFVTWTPRYGKIWNWRIAALERMYGRAELRGTASKVTTKNIAELELDAPAEVSIDGQSLKGKAFVKQMNRWEVRPSKPQLRKRAGLQGPIDDAFLDRFLCVADAPNPALDTFRANFEKYFRGNVRTKASKDVSKADLADNHLVLWGTPATNKLIARVIKWLPVRWNDTEIEVKGQRFDAKTHTLSLIQINPLATHKYVVLNSGHTFTKADLVGTNALLYPRWGDWAVIENATGKPVSAGFFDENWR
jgi:hypothetical protein